MVELSPKSQQRLKKTIEYIRKNIDRKITIEELAANVNISRYHFVRRFKRATGITAMEYVARVRVEVAKERLAQGRPIACVAVSCGFSSQSHLTYAMKSFTGMTPAQYQREAFSPPE